MQHIWQLSALHAAHSSLNGGRVRCWAQVAQDNSVCTGTSSVAFLYLVRGIGVADCLVKVAFLLDLASTKPLVTPALPIPHCRPSTVRHHQSARAPWCL